MDGIETQLYTVERFEVYLRADENRARRLELVHGTVVEKPMPTEEHGLIVANMVFLLKLFLRGKNMGRVVVETAYRASADALNRRIPDLSYTANDDARPLTTQGAVPRMPDLAVEVKSPDDSYAEIREKATYYLNNGVKLVWLVYPDGRRVEVFAAGAEAVTLEAENTLTGGDVLPGFQTKVSAIFED
ncbi:MAG: Uma2 family endonuclease [Chloroflexota bacterium]